MFGYRLRVALLALGVLFGFGSAIRHFAYGHGHWHDRCGSHAWHDRKPPEAAAKPVH